MKRSATNKTIKLTVAALGVSESEAEFIVAIELGEIAGDVVELDEQGNEIEPEAGPLITD